MVNIQYANAYSEVLEILKYISKDEYNKIPKELIEVYKKNANKDYYFYYDPYKTLDEQNVSLITKGVIAILYRDYWATERIIKNYSPWALHMFGMVLLKQAIKMKIIKN